MLEKNRYVDQQLRTTIYLSNVRNYGIDIEVKAYLIPTGYEDYMEAKQSILLGICKIMDQLHIQRAAPLEALQKALSGNSSAR
jgi:hypothetical protein